MAAESAHRTRRTRAQRSSDRPEGEDQLTLPLFDAPDREVAAAIDTGNAERTAERGVRRTGQGVVDDLRSQHDRVLVARIAAAERWARTPDRVEATAPARRGLQQKFEREADPDGVLAPAERARRADQLLRAHMLRMARKSAEARRR